LTATNTPKKNAVEAAVVFHLALAMDSKPEVQERALLYLSGSSETFFQHPTARSGDEFYCY